MQKYQEYQEYVEAQKARVKAARNTVHTVTIEDLVPQDDHVREMRRVLDFS